MKTHVVFEGARRWRAAPLGPCLEQSLKLLRLRSAQAHIRPVHIAIARLVSAIPGFAINGHGVVVLRTDGPGMTADSGHRAQIASIGESNGRRAGEIRRTGTP